MKFLFLAPLFYAGFTMAQTHPDFLSLGEICPTLIIETTYGTPKNFTGAVVDGYKAKKAFMTKVSAQALCEVQSQAAKRGLGLKIFDSYRPVKAVTFFQNWAKLPETNPEVKAIHYPKFTRHELFEAGYIAKQSSHSRGSAVDLTLVNAKTGLDLDMGSVFDFFDDISHTVSPKISADQLQNRLTLRALMEEQGFSNYAQEWWHYSLKPEPYPTEYFDFDVE